MSGWTGDMILKATSGKMIQGKREERIREISTDTRTLKPKDIFVAIRGERFDGHNFILDAVEKGASGLIIDRDISFDISKDILVIKVKDSLKALRQLGAYWRKFLDPKVIAITGSCGKTTTKEIVYHLISQKISCHKNRGNFNNLIGVPLTLLALSPEHRCAVVELGINLPWEMDILGKMVSPNIALITNIGASHIEGLGSIEGVSKAKSKLYNYVDKNGILIVNMEDKRCVNIAERYTQKKIYYGFNQKANIYASSIIPLPNGGHKFILHREGVKIGNVKIRLLGRHNILNALAAFAICNALNLPLKDLIGAISSFGGIKGRMEFFHIRSGAKIINDAYNANPISMHEALINLKNMESRRRIAILGDMLELGDYTEIAHRELGKKIAALNFDRVYLVGKAVRWSLEEAEAKGFPRKKIFYFEEMDHLLPEIPKDLTMGDLVLIKGSHAVGLEKIATYLKEKMMDKNGNREN